jgi:NADPH:quinone reductase-like Zn-dependent oxidoreductase
MQAWQIRGKRGLLFRGALDLLLPSQLCADIVFAATPPYDGTLARYYRIPADLAYELPDNLSLEDGAMVRTARSPQYY